ncbi:MAG: hypothetical protein OHK0046_14600 [Anaerolineae bacterium]
MLKNFTWRHAIALVVVVCLMSIAAGGVLAQDTTGAELPSFNLAGASAPAAVDAPTGLVPADGAVVSSLNPAFDWDDQTGNGTVSYEFELYGKSGFVQSGDQYFPIAAPLTATTLSISGLTETGVDFLDGFQYMWRVRGVDADGAGDWSAASFIVDAPVVSPVDGSSLFSTTPLVTWPEIANVATYDLAAYVPSVNELTWLGEDIPATDICENGQCKARPNSEITVTLDGDFLLGDVQVEIWFQTNDVTGNVLSSWARLTGFTVVAPDLTVNVDGGATEGRPQFSVDRTEVVLDETPAGLLGMTQTFAPDFYRVFLDPDASVPYVASADGQFVDEWFAISNLVGPECFDNGTLTEECLLTAFDGDQTLLYNAPAGTSYTYYVKGYSSVLDAYTNWSDGGNFSLNVPAPAAEEIAIAGVYEAVGNAASPYAPLPGALTSTWVPCGAESGIQTNGGVECESNRPLVHFAPNNGGFSGEWFNILAWDPANSLVVFQQWFNTQQPQTTADGNYFVCGTGFGGGAFPGLTCFFQPAEFNFGPTSGFLNGYNGFVDGGNYEWYIASYGPGGISTGGIANVGYTDPADNQDADGDSFAAFSIAGPDAPTGLGATVEGAPLTNTTSFAGLTATLITGDPVFYWTRVADATWYNVEIVDASNNVTTVPGSINGWVEVGTNGLNCSTLDNVCALSPRTPFFLLNGTYTLNVSYWNGGVSDEASTTFTISNGQAVPVGALTGTMIVYENESLTGTTRPVFQWPHAENNTWYRVVINEPSGATLLGVEPDWVRARDICNYEFVGFDPVTFLPNYVTLCDYVGDFIISGGDYTWSVEAFSPNGTTAMSRAVDYVISSTNTGVVDNVIFPTAAPLTWTNTPTLYFEAAENAAWYQIFIGQNNGGVYTVDVNQWFYRPQLNLAADQFNDDSGAVYCRPNQAPIFAGPDNEAIQVDPETVVCSVLYSPFVGTSGVFDTSETYNTALLENGTYELWIAPYGPQGFNTSASVGGTGWFGPFTFTVDIPATDPVNMSAAFPNGNIDDEVNFLAWPRVQFAQWYYVRVTDTATGEILLGEWNFSSDIGCGLEDFSGFCNVNVDSLDMSPYGVYEWEVGTWGQGNTGDESNLFGATFPENPATFTQL